MKDMAFLKILNTSNEADNETKIRDIVMDLMGFKEILPEEKHIPNGDRCLLIVWRRSVEERLPKDYVTDFVGKKGQVIYLWRCPHCGSISQQYECPGNPECNRYSGCIPPSAAGFHLTARKQNQLL